MVTTADRSVETLMDELTKSPRGDALAKLVHALAFSAYGGWGQCALDFMSFAANMVVERSFMGHITRSAFLTRARRAVSVALTRGNGNLVRTALRLAASRRASVGVLAVSGGGSLAAASAGGRVGGGSLVIR